MSMKYITVIISRYIDNLLSEPNNEKFKRIRKGNKAFMERVAVIKGSEEFLNALGFKLTSIQIDDGKVYVMYTSENDSKTNNLC